MYFLLTSVLFQFFNVKQCRRTINNEKIQKKNTVVIGILDVVGIETNVSNKTVVIVRVQRVSECIVVFCNFLYVSATCNTYNNFTT